MKITIITLALATPLAVGAAESEKLRIKDLLNPDKWFEAFKQNITFPISKDQEIEVPTPERALNGVSPKLREINTDVREETGIDFAKFLGWITKALKAFFGFFIEILERVSSSLG